MPRHGKEPALLFLVHVAGVPAPDGVQRCVACGTELLDRRVEERTGKLPAWWTAGALIATDKPRNGVGVSMIYEIDGGDLDEDERPCTAAR